MGGVTASGSCQTYEIRGDKGIKVRGCLHSKPKYDKLIQVTGSGFFVKPINGVLSGLAASGNTHARYGAVDLEGDGYSKTELYSAARHARDCGFMAYPRLWKNKDGSGNWHIHMADPDCPNMSSALAAQFVLFGKGYDALVGNGPDPLGKYRQAEIMAAYYRKPVSTAPKPPTTTAPKPPAPVKKVNYGYPYTYRAGWYPFPGKPGASYYGPSKAGVAWYSGKTAGGSKTGTGASGGLTLAWIRGHIQRIQRCVGAGVDGRYGDQTVKAVKKWQAAHKLPADGIVGPRTWAAMAKSRGQ
jgi:peptidoglycan hydrolase-like protein with peptidoglycan-binding domain